MAARFHFQTTFACARCLRPTRLLSINASSFHSQFSFSFHRSFSTTSSPDLQNKKKTDSDNKPARPYEEIPKTKYFLGVNWEIMKKPYGLVDYLEKQVRTHGKIFRDKGGPGVPEVVYIVDPKDVELVYRAGDSGYPMRFPMTAWSQARDELKLPYGMFLEKNEKWLKQRVPISKYIMMPHMMANYSLPFNEVSLDFIRYIREKREEGNMLSDVVGALNRWSFESVSLFVLGKRLGCLEDPMPQDCREFVDNVRGFIHTTNKLVIGLPLHRFIKTQNWKNLVKHFEMAYSIARGLVKTRIEEIDRRAQTGEGKIKDDFLSHMIYSGKMSTKEVAVNAIDLLAAGVDTTSLTIAACLYCLATNPEVQDKLRKEVQEVVGEVGVVTHTHIQNMPYLRDCVKETQRLYPVAPQNSRILGENVVLSGYNVPAGVPIVIGTAVSGRLPEHFPEPEKLKPERWSRESKELPNPFMSLPFGFGRRMCVGRRVSELETHILLARLIQNFDLKFTEEKPLKYIFNWFYRPERDMNIVFNDL